MFKASFVLSVDSSVPSPVAGGISSVEPSVVPSSLSFGVSSVVPFSVVPSSLASGILSVPLLS